METSRPTFSQNFKEAHVRPLLKIISSSTRGQPATIIPRPAGVIEILQGTYFPEVSRSVLQ